jgi:GNAT acetyltransferase
MNLQPHKAHPEQHQVLARALGDTPESVISVHLLARALAEAYVAGDPTHPDGLIVQGSTDPGELMSFGSDAAVLWELLQLVEGWWCVSVVERCARDLGAMIEAQTGSKVRYYGDIYHVLRGSVTRLHHEATRLLTPDDIELVEAAPTEVRGSGWNSTREMLGEGVVAGAVVRGNLVAIAYTSARSARHADVAVNTLEGWRGRGFATAAASLVARRLQEAGQIPVWSTGETNRASLRVARELGFAPVAQRTYVILD